MVEIVPSGPFQATRAALTTPKEPHFSTVHNPTSEPRNWLLSKIGGSEMVTLEKMMATKRRNWVYHGLPILDTPIVSIV
jgi:hypothetical protein